MFSLVAVDMDCTFLNSNHNYDRERFARIHRYMLNVGIRFVVASGNQYYQLKSFFEDYPDIVYIAQNGAYIRDSTTTYAIHTFYPKEAERIMRVLSNDSNISVVAAGFDSAHIREDERPSFIKQMSTYYRRLTLEKSLSQLNDQIFDFAVEVPSNQNDEYMEKFRRVFDEIAVPTSSGHREIDIIQPGRHKAAGLVELGDALRIPLNKMIAFGDGGNDVEMLRKVGLGVAMKNASPEALAAADEVTSLSSGCSKTRSD